MLHPSPAFKGEDIQNFGEGGGGGGEPYMGGIDSSLETMRWLNTLLKYSIRKSFVIKKVLQIITMIQK